MVYFSYSFRVNLSLFSEGIKIYILNQEADIHNQSYAMDHSPNRQTYKFENNFSTVRKSFLNLVKL